VNNSKRRRDAKLEEEKQKDESKEVRHTLEQQHMKIDEIKARLADFENKNVILVDHAEKLSKLFRLGVIDEDGNYIDPGQNDIEE
jgi:archaellum component FlaC